MGFFNFNNHIITVRILIFLFFYFLDIFLASFNLVKLLRFWKVLILCLFGLLGIFYKNNHIINKQELFLFLLFQSYAFFVCLFYIISLAGTSSTMLNKNGESGHCRLVPTLRGKAFSFQPLSILLHIAFQQLLFVKFREFSSISIILNCFYYKWALNFIKYFFLYQLI